MNCPFCHQILYSRQHAKCGACGGTLPPDFRLEAHVIDELKAEMRAIDARREVMKEKEERQKRDAGDGGWPGGGACGGY